MMDVDVLVESGMLMSSFLDPWISLEASFEDVGVV